MEHIDYLKTDNLKYFDHVNKDQATHFSHRLFTSGDYDGSSVERTNRKVLLENTDLIERLGIVEIHEHYSTDSLIFPIAALEDQELKEIFEGLENYPCLDDEALSEVEHDMETEDFESFGRKEFRNFLIELGVLSDIAEIDLGKLYHEFDFRTNYGVYSVESGTSGFFDFDSFGGLTKDKAIEILKGLIE